MKPRIRCELLGLDHYGDQRYCAYVRRYEHHPKLGEPPLSATRTSLILRIDFEKKEIETLNTIYCYGG